MTLAVKFYIGVDYNKDGSLISTPEQLQMLDTIRQEIVTKIGGFTESYDLGHYKLNGKQVKENTVVIMAILLPDDRDKVLNLVQSWARRFNQDSILVIFHEVDAHFVSAKSLH